MPNYLDVLRPISSAGVEQGDVPPTLPGNPPGYQLTILQLNSVLALSTWKQHQIPQVMTQFGLDYHPHFRCQFQICPPLVQVICQCGSQNSGKHSTYQITSLLQRILLKDRNQQPDEGIHSQDMGKGLRASMFSPSTTLPPWPHIYQLAPIFRCLFLVNPHNKRHPFALITSKIPRVLGTLQEMAQKYVVLIIYLL